MPEPTELNLLCMPPDPEAKYQALLTLFRQLKKQEPTIQDKNAVRAELNLPLLFE